ncbi:MAG: hypothetical protein OEW37_10655 [Rhodospirillaceae bacterium]|nr:hypothetical protein [Rhodospirillaceae bacterium]
MEKPLIIGLSGRHTPRCNAAAMALLIKTKPEIWGSYGFKAPVERMLAMIGVHRDGITPRDETARLHGKTYSELETSLAEDWGKKLIHPDLWLALADRALAYAAADKVNLVFPDVKTETEAQHLRARGGHIIHIEDDKPTSRRMGSPVKGAQDYRVTDTGTLEELQTKIMACYWDIKTLTTPRQARQKPALQVVH